MAAERAFESAAPSDGTEITDLVAAAIQAHCTGGEAALAEFCAGLPRHRDAVLQRLSALRRAGLFGDEMPATPEFPGRLGDFELLEPLGRGGMGVVYRARQISLDREVALKLIRPEQLHFPGVRERFQREVEIVARLQHDGVVQLYSFGEDRGIPWFAMELIRGASLAHLIDTLGQQASRALTGAELLPCLGAGSGGDPSPLFHGEWTEVALRIVERVALALDQAHQQGVLHRDIKPSNIMLTASGRVVLLDFGLAWTRTADRLTRSGSELGTIHYMAPEQFRDGGARIDERTDVYALGVVLRELVTLHPVFTGATVDEVARQVREGLCTPFGGSRTSLRRDVETICLVAMDPDPQRRYGAARLLARDLRCVLERRPIEAVRPGLGLRLRRFAERNRAVTVAAAVAGLALLSTPVVVAVRERGLRRELEQTNQSLATEIARAGQNLDLATRAIEETLTRIEEERLSGAPDLAAFVERALASSTAFIDGLAASNPEDPAARLRLAQTLAKVAFVQWSFYDLARTEPLFVRTMQLLEGSEGDRDTMDGLELEVRLALVYVQRLSPEDSIRAYETGLERVRRSGPVERRSIRLRALVARCLDRCGGLLQQQGQQRGTSMLREAAALREAIAAVEPSVTAWVEVAISSRELAADCRRQKDADGGAQNDARFDEALLAAEQASADASVDDRERLLSVLLQATMAAHAQPERAVGYLERAERHAHRSMEQRPSRVSDLLAWLDVTMRLVSAYERAGRIGDAVASAQRTLLRARTALVMWPNDPQVLRMGMSVLRWSAQLSDRHAVAALDGDRLIEDALVAAVRVPEAMPQRAATLDECNRVYCERSRRRARSGNAEGALEDAREAARFLALARERATADRVYLGIDRTPLLLQAEALLQLGRDDECLALLSPVGDLPPDTLELAPTLSTRKADARFAAVMQRVQQRR